jgi:uncharacterized membrane protein
MDPVLGVALLWALFGGSHVALATDPVRELLVRALGKVGFLWAYALVATVAFTALVVTYVGVQNVGPRGLALGVTPFLGEVLGGAAFAGILLMVGGFAPSGYWESPSAVLSEGVPPARGLGRITRHPIFSGIVLVMGAHALLARYATGTVFFGGFVILALVGSQHQAHKLRKRLGAAFDEYLRETSAIPFLAILRGRQSLALGELPWKALALGVVIAILVQQLHRFVLAHSGAPFLVVIAGGSVVVGLVSMRRARRVGVGPS